MRLQIRPGLHVVSRGGDSMQIGLDPEHGAVLEGLSALDRRLLAELADGIDESTLAGNGEHGERARRLLRLLAGTGVVVRDRAGRATLAELGPDLPRLAPDAAVWGLVHPDTGDGWQLLADRRHRTVEVRGAGRLPLTVVTLLRAAGIGCVRTVGGCPVRPGDTGPAGAALADVGASAAEAARLAGSRVSAQPRAPDPGGPPDLVVLAGVAVADNLAGDDLLAAGVAHLAVVVRERDVVVGPLVVPGEAACLRCLDMHRTDRDPGWPHLLAQLLARPPAAPAGETASCVLAASLATLQVLAHLDGRTRPAAVGATLEVDLPDGLTSRRPWPVHPACGCRRDATSGHRERSSPPEGTMAW